MDSIADVYFQAPPVARSFATLALIISVSVHFGLLPFKFFFFHPYYIWKFPPEIWRIPTSFLITGNGLGLLFDTYFTYMYMSQLEVGHARLSRKEDLLWYLMFVSGTILVINVLLGLGSGLFLRALIIAMAYTVTQDQRGMKANFYFITIPAQLTPFCMILINLLFPGGVDVMIVQLHGLVAAHLFDFLSRIWPEFGRTRRNLIPTPKFLTPLVNTVGNWSARIGLAGPQAAPSGPTAGGSSGSGGSRGSGGGVLPDSWRTRGPGHRLG